MMSKAEDQGLCREVVIEAHSFFGHHCDRPVKGRGVLSDRPMCGIHLDTERRREKRRLESQEDEK